MDPRISVFVLAAVSLVTTVLWMVVQIVFALRTLREAKGGAAVDRRVVIAWIVSAGGAFTGPLAALFALFGIVAGLVSLRREPNAPTRQAALGMTASSTVLLAMIVLILGVTLGSGLVPVP